MAEAGADIVLNGTSEERLTAAAEKLSDTGRRIHAITFDVTDETAVVVAFSELDRRGFAIDILVNNAGIQLRKPMPGRRRRTVGCRCEDEITQPGRNESLNW